MARAPGRIVVIAGPCGAGKTTLAAGLLEAEPTLERVTTFTTRESRSGEVDGVDYHFVAQSDFDELVTDGEALDVTTVGSASYGLMRSSVEDVLQRNQVPVIVVDPNGGLRIAERIPSLTMFVSAPIEELRVRLLARGDRRTMIESRLGSYESDVALGARYDHRFIGGSAEHVLANALTVVRTLLHPRSDRR